MRAVSLFSGCGGSDLGLHDAGFEILLANDISPAAYEAYVWNLPATDFRVGDVSEIRSFPAAQLLVGCYPCQGFSQGGARDSTRTINFLYREFDRALRSIKPRAFIVENVAGMTLSNHSHLLKNQLHRFRSAGYRVKWALLNAVDFGVPQERRRVFIVGVRSDLGVEYSFPEPTHGLNRLHSYVTQRQAISDLPEWPAGEFWEEPFHWYYMSRDRRRSWDEPSKTIVSAARHMPLHPSSPPVIKLCNDQWVFESDQPARRLSYREALRLQGFPTDYDLPPTLALRQRYAVIGNAVPPPLFHAVVKAIPTELWN